MLEPSREWEEMVFPGTEFNRVDAVNRNPARELALLHAEAMESLANAIAATHGTPENTPYALSKFVVERASDPIRVAEIMMKMSLFGSQLN